MVQNEDFTQEISTFLATVKKDENCRTFQRIRMQWKHRENDWKNKGNKYCSVTRKAAYMKRRKIWNLNSFFCVSDPFLRSGFVSSLFSPPSLKRMVSWSHEWIAHMNGMSHYTDCSSGEWTRLVKRGEELELSTDFISPTPTSSPGYYCCYCPVSPRLAWKSRNEIVYDSSPRYRLVLSFSLSQSKYLKKQLKSRRNSSNWRQWIQVAVSTAITLHSPI